MKMRLMTALLPALLLAETLAAMADLKKQK
jgi:hypothetical protein